jgi:hypothetical protein
MGRRRRLLKIAIFNDIHSLPFPRNNFGRPFTNVWNHNESSRKNVALGADDLSDMTLTIEVNGFEDMKYNYSLKSFYELQLIDDSESDVETRCTVIELQAINEVG